MQFIPNCTANHAITYTNCIISVTILCLHDHCHAPSSECLSKFGDELGMEVWEATNQAFDRMPIATVIDKKVRYGTVKPSQMVTV